MNGIQNPELNNIAVFMPKDMAYKNEAVENPQARIWILESKNKKNVKNYRKKREELEMLILNVIYCVAPLTCSNLDERKKMSIEDVVKNITIFQVMIKQTSLF